MQCRSIIIGFSLFASLYLLGLFFAPTTPVTAYSLAHDTVLATPAIPHYWTDTFESMQTIEQVAKLEIDTTAGQLHLALRDAIVQQMAVVARGPNQELYVVWQDLRNDAGDIYAQRLNLNGQPLWPKDVRVNSDDGQAVQSAPTATTDELGNLIVAWADKRNEHNEIYGQRIDVNGNPQWPEDMAFQVDTSNADHDQPTLAATANGAFIVAWHDNRAGDYNIYAQAIGVAAGNRLWTNDLQVNGDGNGTGQSNPALVSDGGNGDGGDGVVVAWLDQRTGNGDIYAQHISAQGGRLWSVEPQLNAASVKGIGRPSLATTGDGWTGVWLGANDNTIYAQHLSATGQAAWAINPKVTGYHSQADPEATPLVAALPAGEAFVAWVSAEDGAIYGQRLNANGAWSWSAARQLNSQLPKHANIHHPASVSISDEKVFLAWADDRDDEQWDIYAQVVDGNGAPTWGGERAVNTRSGVVAQSAAAVAVAPDGGSVLAWRDARGGTPAIFLQRLDVAGNRLWSEQIIVNAQVVSATSQLAPSLALVGNDTFVTWSDERNGRTRLFLQRFDGRGFRQWNTPVAVSPPREEGTLQFNPLVRANNQGQIYVAWEELLNNQRRVVVQQLDSAGVRQWSTDLIAPATGDARSPTLAVNGATIALGWLSGEWPDTDLYLEQLDPTGKFLWSAPVRVNRFSGLVDQFNQPAVVVSDNGDVVAVWVDKRNYDAYAQRIDKNGNSVWATDLRLNEASSTVLLAPDVTAPPGGDALFVWQGLNNGEFTILAQRIDKLGQRVWPSTVAGGLVVSKSAHQAQRPRIASDASGAALIVWSDQRRQNDDIFTQRLNNQGASVWNQDLSSVASDYFYAQQGFARSKAVPTDGSAIAEATLTANVNLNGGQISFWLSNDGGAHWAAVEPNVRHRFTTSGKDLRWQVMLQANPLNPTQSPVVQQLELVYEPKVISKTVADEPDDSCLQAHPLQIDGAPQPRALASPDNVHLDEDWVRLNVQPNTLYDFIVQPPPTRRDALRLEGYQDCTIQTTSGAVSTGNLLHLRIQSASATFFVRVAPISATVTANIPYTISVRQAQGPGLAILVDSALLAGDPHQPQVDQATAYAYRTLLAHGYTAQQIFYLSHDLTQDANGDGMPDVDALATLANLQNAIEQWPGEQWNTQANQQAARFLLYLTGHGDQQGFYLADGAVVNTATLNRWLANLETTGHVAQSTILIDTNAAGAFLGDSTQLTGRNNITKTLAGPNRIVLASTTTARLAWPTSRGMLFSDALWTTLAQGYSLGQGFGLAQQTVADSGYGCTGAETLCQWPLLADGHDRGDLAGLSLAYGWGLTAPYLTTGPAIDDVQVHWEKGNPNGVIEATIHGVGPDGRVEAQIFSPNFAISAPPPGHLPMLTSQVVTLNWAGALDNAQPPTARYQAVFTGFSEPADYQIVLYAWDAQAQSALPYTTHFSTKLRYFLPIIGK